MDPVIRKTTGTPTAGGPDVHDAAIRRPEAEETHDGRTEQAPRQAASRWIKRLAPAIEDNEMERDLRSNAARHLPASAQRSWETAIDAMKLARRAVLAGVVAAFTAVLLLWIEAVLLAANGDPGPGANVAVAATISVLVGAALIVGGSYGARTGDPLVQTGGLALVAAAGGASVYYLIW